MPDCVTAKRQQNTLLFAFFVCVSYECLYVCTHVHVNVSLFVPVCVCLYGVCVFVCVC